MADPRAPQRNPWRDARLVVVSDDPPSVEAAVTQLEAWGAEPAVMFERGRALQALQVREPDVVVLDFGRRAGEARGLLGSLEEVKPMMPGQLHPAPVVVLAPEALEKRIEANAWAPIHVAPHDDQEKLRAALVTALREALSDSPAPTPVAAPTAASPRGLNRSAVIPVVASLVLAAGAAALLRRLLPAGRDTEQPAQPVSEGATPAPPSPRSSSPAATTAAQLNATAAQPNATAATVPGPAVASSPPPAQGTAGAPAPAPPGDRPAGEAPAAAAPPAQQAPASEVLAGASAGGASAGGPLSEAPTATALVPGRLPATGSRE